MRELILNFHGLGEPPPEVSGSERRVWVPVDWLEAIVDVMPSTGVRLTFDDGNKSDIENALDVLAGCNRRATFFVLAGEMGGRDRLSRAQVSKLHERGMAIGSHGLNHVNWRHASDLQLERELYDSRQILMDLVNGDVSEVAIPFGQYDRRVLAALRESGYKRAYTSDGVPTRTSSWLAPRVSVNVGRPLQSWLQLAAAGPSARLGSVQSAKLLMKRLR